MSFVSHSVTRVKTFALFGDTSLIGLISLAILFLRLALPLVRLMARHQTNYAQVLAAVSPQTRADYCALLGCRP